MVVRQRLGHKSADERQPADTDIDPLRAVENTRVIGDEVVFLDSWKICVRHRH
ncbi:hypothetical protein FHT76_004277 [Rhizobium sp. BK176]|nr:hypothetical protein [Rhizobium sp. BK176]